MSKIIFSNEDLQRIIHLYVNEKRSVSKVADVYSVNPTVIKGVLKEQGIKIRNNREIRSLPIDTTFFEVIDTPEKAYVLGFMYADGYVTGKRFGIKLKNSDKDFLIKIRDILKSEHKVGTYVQDTPYGKVEYCSFNVNNIKMVNDLIKQGVVYNKSRVLKFPHHLPTNLLSHFIRGYFDGDGSVYKVKQGNTIGISFVGTEDFLNGILETFKTVIDTKTHVFPYPNKEIYDLKIGGRANVKKIYDYLYRNAEIFLARKKLVFEEVFGTNRKDVQRL